MQRKRAMAGAEVLAMVVVVAVVMVAGAGQAEACSRVVGRRAYARCQDLGAQGASIAYSYNGANRRLDVAFFGQAVAPGGWVGWGINPTSWGMAGASALVAFRAGNGSNVLPFKLTAAVQAGQRLASGPTDLAILNRQAIIRGSSFTILASLRLRPGQSTVLNMVWNRGSATAGFSPLPHSLLPQDLRGFASIDVAA